MGGGQLKNHPVCHINVNLLLPSSFIQYLRVKSEIWDLGTKLGPFGDHFWTLVPIGTKSQIWDLVTSTANGKSFLEPFQKKNYLPNQSNAEWPEREATKALIDVTTSCL